MSKYKKNEDILSSMSNLQPNLCLKIDFQKVDQHAGGKWLIHDAKHRKDNQFGHVGSVIWCFISLGVLSKWAFAGVQIRGFSAHADVL